MLVLIGELPCFFWTVQTCDSNGHIVTGFRAQIPLFPVTSLRPLLRFSLRISSRELDIVGDLIIQKSGYIIFKHGMD